MVNSFLNINTNCLEDAIKYSNAIINQYIWCGNIEHGGHRNTNRLTIADMLYS